MTSTYSDLEHLNQMPGADLPVCRRGVSAHDTIAAVCPNCQHNTLIHGGAYTNPGLDGCAVCRLINLLGLPRAPCLRWNKKKQRCLRGWGHDGKHAYVDPKGVLYGR